MIQRPDAGREPEFFRGEQRRLRIQYDHRRDGSGVREAALASGRLVGHPHAMRPLRPGERRRHGDVHRIAELSCDRFHPVYDASAPEAQEEIRAPCLCGGPLDDALRRVLAHARIGARMLLAEQRLDAPDEISLLEQRAPGDDESPVRRPGLLLYLLQTTGAAMDPLCWQEGVGAAAHGAMVLLRAASGTKGDLSAPS